MKSEMRGERFIKGACKKKIKTEEKTEEKRWLLGYRTRVFIMGGEERK